MFAPRWFSVAALILMVPAVTIAEDRIWTGAADSDFFNATNWEGGAPTTDEDLAVVDGGENFPVVIPATTETVELGGFQLGTSGETGGHVVQNGGTLNLASFNMDGIVTDFEFKSHIGDKGSLDSSWVMNNDSVLLLDNPLEGAGLDWDGENGFDLEVGAGTGEAVGRLELHDNAILRISDDLKIGAEDFGNGHVIIDGNAIATVGSGISVGEKADGKGILEVGGNALLVSGNSAGPGQSDIGSTDEGYLALSVNETGTADVTISDSASVYVRTIQQRAGVSNLTVQDAGQLHVFDVYEFEAPDLGNATVAGSVNGPQRTSHIGAQVSAEATIVVKDDGVISIDSELSESAWSGLALSGGTNRGANDAGGKTLVEVRDRGSFTVQHDLHMTLGEGETAESTLKVVGPDATVAVNGNLYMALNIEGIENIGTATLHSIITGNSHSTVVVAGDAEIGNGSLAVELDGYSPRGGEVYTLLQAGSVVGDEFFETDLSMAELPEGLGWDLAIDETSVILSVTGMLEGILGDFDSMNGLDVADIDALASQINAMGSDTGFDLNGDGAITSDDITVWLGLKSDDAGTPIVAGDSDLNGAVNFADFLVLSDNFGDTDTTWSQGNFDGVGGTAFADFLLLSANFGTAAGAESQSVPEPTAGCMLLAIGLIGLRVRRSQK